MAFEIFSVDFKHKLKQSLVPSSLFGSGAILIEPCRYLLLLFRFIKFFSPSSRLSLSLFLLFFFLQPRLQSDRRERLQMNLGLGKSPVLNSLG